MANLMKGPLQSNVKDFRPEVSVGKVLFDTLRDRPADMVSMLDSSTNITRTFNQIHQQSVQLAIAMQNLGIGETDVVSIVCENSLDYSIPLVASFYIGAIINPLNPTFTTRELKNALEISKPKIVFVSPENVEKLLKIKEDLQFIHEIVDMSSANTGVQKFVDLLEMGTNNMNDFKPVEVVNTKEKTCAILYSSGTTGLPKGVMITHENMSYAFAYIMDPELIDVSSKEITIGVMPFYYAFGLILCMASVLCGMKVILLSKFKPDEYLKIIGEHKVTKLFVVPPLALFLAKSPMVNNFDMSSLRDIICSAAPIGQEIQNLLEQRLKLTLRQAYGMTETCGCTILTPKNRSKIGSSGKLIFSVECKVIDVETNESVGPNKNGEIYVRTPLAMKGYLGNQEAAKNAFDSEGFFKTGDIGYYDDEGYFYIVDRVKELIKYKGFQVAPAELEDLLTSHASIKDAAVIGVPDERAGELPLAFVVKMPEVELSAEDVKAHIAEQSSIHNQLHGGVRFIDEIPKSPTGKILRRLLRDLLKAE